MKINIQQLLEQYLEVSLKIKKGKKGLNFAVRTDKFGIDDYETTDLESQFNDITRKFIKIVNEETDSIDYETFKKFGKIFSNAHPAVDSYRGRTPANGGDWTDINSPVKYYLDELRSLLYDIFGEY